MWVRADTFCGYGQELLSTYRLVGATVRLFMRLYYFADIKNDNYISRHI